MNSQRNIRAFGKRRAGQHATRLFAVAGLLTSTAAPATDHDYAYLAQFGSLGSGNGQFGILNFMAVDQISHDILVSDSLNNRIEIFSEEGTYLRQVGSAGTGPGQFTAVSGVAVDPSSRNIIVTDGGFRVDVFNWNGTYLRTFGSSGSGDGQFNGAADVAIDPVSHDIVVTDLNNHRVQIFDANGNFLGKFGSSANFSYALYLTIDPSTRNILVGDELNCNVQIYGASGTYLRQFGTCGNANGQFSNAPGDLVVDATTHDISVQDYAHQRVQVFDTNGAYLSQFGGVGNGDGQFEGPTGMDLDQASHHLVVLDRGNNRAEIFALTASPPPPPPSCGATQVYMGMDPLVAPTSESILFSAQAQIAPPYTGTVSFVVDGGGTTCTASMDGINASCLHALGIGTHSVVAKYSGDGQNPAGCSAAQSITIIADGGQGPSGLNCTLTPNPGLQGQAILSTCMTSAGTAIEGEGIDGSAAPTGYLTFSNGDDVLGYVPVLDGVAYFATTLAGGSYSLTASYSGDADYAVSSDALPIVVQTPADDIFYAGFERLPN